MTHALNLLLRSCASSFLTRSQSTFRPVTLLKQRSGQQGGTSWETGPKHELSDHPNPLAIFCYQVFFEYVPSSATSLLSSADITARE